jgi:hypothetical protein
MCFEALTLASLETAKTSWLNKVNTLGSAPEISYMPYLFVTFISYQIWGLILFTVILNKDTSLLVT